MIVQWNLITVETSLPEKGFDDMNGGEIRHQVSIGKDAALTIHHGYERSSNMVSFPIAAMKQTSDSMALLFFCTDPADLSATTHSPRE